MFAICLSIFLPGDIRHQIGVWLSGELLRPGLVGIIILNTVNVQYTVHSIHYTVQFPCIIENFKSFTPGLVIEIIYIPSFNQIDNL